MNSNTPPTIDVALTLDSIEVLVKTVGIAIQNLLAKQKRLDPATRISALAADEVQSLIVVQQGLLGALQEAG